MTGRIPEEFMNDDTKRQKFEKVQALTLSAINQLKAALGENGRVIVACAIEEGDSLTMFAGSNGPILSTVGLLEYTEKAIRKTKIIGI